MAKLNDLPAELILNIANRLTSKQADQSSLAALASVAQDINPTLKKSCTTQLLMPQVIPALPYNFCEHS